MSDELRTLVRLERVIAQRAGSADENSYTSQLLASGLDAIGVKIIEESAELVEAAAEDGDEGRSHFVHEAADLMYHFLVLLRHRKVNLTDVEKELAKRFGTSGLEEKAGRMRKEG